MELVASLFEGRGRPGDFAWMLEQADWADALFVFNDNEEQFRASRHDPVDPIGCSPGAGNAVIRPYRCTDPPRAAGIPTGVCGVGYAQLTPEVAEVLDDALEVVAELVATGRYRRLVYSAHDASGRLGTGIFEVGDDVRDHIVAGLRRIAATGSAVHVSGPRAPRAEC